MSDAICSSKIYVKCAEAPEFRTQDTLPNPSVSASIIRNKRFEMIDGNLVS